jgi:ATP-binding cassette subfamily F protein uup
MEASILAAEEEVLRIEALFADPDFFVTRSQEAAGLEKKLAETRHEIARLYARWEELEVLRS